ncbi:MAG: hypothetical protein ACJ74Z_18785 [Bryobacteraceae bacterium]
MTRFELELEAKSSCGAVCREVVLEEGKSLTGLLIAYSRAGEEQLDLRDF